MAEVQFSRRAVRTLHDIREYLTTHSPQGASRVLAEIQHCCTLIGSFPSLGRTVEATNLRCHITRRYRYRILYRVRGDIIEIADILHPSRK